MVIVAFSLASCAFAFAILAYTRYENLEKRIKELEDKITEK